MARKHVSSIKDLLRRTYSHVNESVYYAPSDRIGRNYSPMAQGLTMKQLKAALAGGAPPAKSLAVPPKKPRAPKPGESIGDEGLVLPPTRGGAGGDGRRGPALGHSRSDTTLGSRRPRGPAEVPDLAAGDFHGLGGSGSAARLTSFPKPVSALSVSPSRTDQRRGAPDGFGHGSDYADMEGGGPAMREWRPAAEIDDNDTSAADARLSPREYEALLQREVTAYWDRVARIAHDDELAELKREWEDGVFMRLAVDPSQGFGDDEDFEGAGGASKAGAMVSAMLEDMREGYLQSVKRSMLDYDLRSSDARHHHGLNLSRVDSTRYIHPPIATAASCGISHDAVTFAGQSIARQLHVTEPCLSELWQLWWRPSRPYSTLLLTEVDNVDFRMGLPLLLDEFGSMVDQQCERAASVLKHQWQKDAAEIVAGFVIALEEPDRSGREAEDGDRAAQGVSRPDPGEQDFHKFFKSLTRPGATYQPPKPGAKSAAAAAVAAGAASTPWAGEAGTESAAEGDDGDEVTRLLHGVFRSAATIMSIRLHDVVYRSLDSFMHFMERYSDPDAERRTALRDRTPLFNVALACTGGQRMGTLTQDAGSLTGVAGNAVAVSHKGQSNANQVSPLDLLVGDVGFSFNPSLEEVEERIIANIEGIVASVGSLPRVEQEIAVSSGGAGAGGAKGDAGFPSTASAVLASVQQDDEAVVRAKARAREIVRVNREGPEALLARFDKFKFLFSESEREENQAFVEGEHSLVECADRIERYKAIQDEISAVCDDIEVFAMFSVHALALKNAVKKQAGALISAIMHRVQGDFGDTCGDMNSRYAEISSTLSQTPTSSEELVALNKFWTTVVVELAEMTNAFHGRDGAKDHLMFLVRYQGTLSKDEHVLFRDTFRWPAKIADAQEKCQSVLDLERNKMVEKLEWRGNLFEKEIKSWTLGVENLRKEAGLTPGKVAELLKRVATLKKSLTDGLEEAEKINEQEQLLDLEVTDYAATINIALKDLDPFDRLWTTVGQYLHMHQAWYDSPLLTNDPEAAEKEGDGVKVAMMRMAKELDPEIAPEPRRVAVKVKEEVDQFLKKDHALLALLANPGIKDRHWTGMEEKLGHEVPHSETTSLNDMIQLGLDVKIDDIEEICVNASKEYSIEKAMDKMESEWAPVILQLKSWKETGTSILTSTSCDEVQELLDDHIVKAQTMQASRYAKPHAERIKNWVDALTEVQNVMDVWLKVQGTWLYLEPIFGSEDIMRQMPAEGKKFQTVDATWRSTMAGAVADPAALKAMRQPGMLDKLREAQSLLDEIQKGLNAYLETKRGYFPRFYFLSNDELLEILAETKDPLRVQPHLKKSFEGIAKLQFEDNLDITAMYSAANEKVPFTKEENGGWINPNDAKGNVEVWMLQVEAAMRRSVAFSVDSCVKDYLVQKRVDWAQLWPGQVVLCVGQIYWTQEVEEGLKTGGAEGVRLVAENLTSQLNDVVILVRGKLPKLIRKTLAAMVTLDVHSRDVTQGLADAGVDSVNHFDWLSQLRYYWTDDGQSAKTGKPISLAMRMINAQVMYANEYLGNQPRLVVTPLTDRCYRTLMGAVHLNLGGAPEGPAGTGKTETVKDLSKAAGMMCVVFNCSDGLDYLAMAKFFKGLASSGAWACFDEFNRIQLEVLSVVAQQILSIQRAKNANVEIFEFEGSTLKLNPVANVFITMNPGYAGRAELPDNLKALFRTVAMMVPDYRIIAEIILYSNGYMDAKSMSRKIVGTFKLCSEQLSSQFHYDYGMRAVFTVLVSASNLKRAPDCAHLPEDVLVLQAIVDANLPKFLSHDVPLFNGICQDLFPGIELNPRDRSMLVEAMKDACYDKNLQTTDLFITKTLQIYEMMLVRHGFMVVGDPFGAKSSAIKVLAAAMGKLHERYPDDTDWSYLHHIVINPKSITMGQLYGCFDDVTHEWSDGVLAYKYRKAANAKIGGNERKWMLFDGPVDAIWIENMNTVLDDNKKLCLMSGEIVAMSETMNMVFEPMDLAVASPATVSRCGMIFMEPTLLGWHPLVHSWLDYLAEDNNRYDFRPMRPSRKDAAERHAAALEAKKKAEAEKQAAWASVTARESEVTGGESGEAKAAAADAEASEKESKEGNTEGKGEEDSSESKGDAGATAAAAPAAGPREPKLLKDAPPGTVPFGTIVHYDNDDRPFTIDSDARKQIEALFDWCMTPCMVFLRKRLKEYSPTHDMFLVRSLMQLLECTLAQVVQAGKSDGYKVGVLEMKGKEEPSSQDIEALFIWSLIWSVGASTDAAGRDVFSEFVRGFTEDPDYLANHELNNFFRLKGWKEPEEEMKLATPFPARGQVHDYVYSAGDNRWRKWEDTLPPGTIPAGTAYENIIVPTVYTAQFNYTVDLLVTYNKPLLVCGPTGTGKSAYMKKYLQQTLDPDAFLPIMVAFSARTSANRTQDQVDQKLDRRRKGVFGPRLGIKCIIFVDDLNLPEPEFYGAQPPIELLRQLCDAGGWYDLQELEFKSIIDTVLVSAMGPSGGGRNSVTPRLLRHFNLVCFPDLDESTLSRIFGTIVDWSMSDQDFPSDIAQLSSLLVNATRDVYQKCLMDLRPTPSKMHYTFNLRDFSRIVQGMLMGGPDKVTSKNHMIRLWLHEVLRVIFDRLVDDKDRTWCNQFLREVIKKHFGIEMNELLAHLRQDASGDVTDNDIRYLFWGDFYDPKDDKRQYAEAESFEATSKVLVDQLEDYNAMTKSPMDLVMFLFFIEHVNRISRVLKMKGGHCMLVGVGGSGRQSSTRLAAHMSDFQVLGIELTRGYGMLEWHDDLKRIMKAAGLGTRHVVFMFLDTQIKWEGMVEDISNILNSGEVPNLFGADERGEILEGISGFAVKEGGLSKDASPTELMNYFVLRMKQRLHVVVCMSPIGDAFRDRLRKFPSLVNCCTIDWFQSWPEDALSAVAHKSLKETGISDDSQRDDLARMCMHFHFTVRALSGRFMSEARRQTYVTPTSYMELLGMFKSNLDVKRGELVAARDRYVVGLEKLAFAADQVAVMQKELQDLQPVLKVSQAETAELMVQIEAKLPGVEATRKVVKAEADVANAEAQKVAAVKKECEDDLAEAIPALEAALKALNTLKPSDITNVKSMTNPPAGVRLVMSAVCVMLQVKPDRVKGDDGVKMVEDFWPPSKRLLGDLKFLDRLKKYDKDNMDPKIIAKIAKVYVPDPEFTPDKVANASSAAEGMCRWVLAMVSYDRVAKIVAPKKIALAQSEKELEVTMGELAKKEASLKEVEDELGALQAQFEAANEKKKDLERQVDLCEKKLVRAEQLIGGLGGEQSRWTEAAAQLKQRLHAVVGDVLLASAMMAYLGPFTAEYRGEQVQAWVTQCVKEGVPVSVAVAPEGDKPGSKGFGIEGTLGNQIEIREWHIQGLPTDSFSVENGIIVKVAKRWPLCIDPQGQANKWIRNREKDESLKVVKQTDPTFLRTLENAVQFGQPVLLENVPEELDPALEPILLQNTFKQGGVVQIRLGDATVEYSESFRFYITTKLRNPHYLPEVSAKVTLINFMITPKGLEDQLLGTVVGEERPDLQEAKNKLIIQGAENRRALQEVEDKILHVLSSSEGNILEDETAINVLNSSKAISTDIKAKQAVAFETEAKIDETRAGYQPVAFHGQVLFFCITDLAAIDPMYQYSMEWFVTLYVNAIRKSEKSTNLEKRIRALNDYFTFSLFQNVCRSLFEKDKLLFSFLLTIKIMMGKELIDPEEWYFLLTGGVALDNPHKNHCNAWLTDKQWGEVCRLSDLKAFEGLREEFARPDLAAGWQALFNEELPHRATLPGKWGAEGALTRMQKLLVLRTIRPDKVGLGIQDFVRAEMGQRFLEPPPFDLGACHSDSNCTMPLVFVLSPGSDPMAQLLKFAADSKIQVNPISLGQGQGPVAEAMIEKARREGTWVVLQNCHLAVSWMPRLEGIVEELSFDNTDEHFRMWCTSYPSKDFPVSVLQNGVKMTNEPPKGLKQNVKRSFLLDPISDPSFFGGVKNGQEFRRLCFALCFFHALVQERRQFAALGWNIPYEFNDSDLRISVRQLAMFLDDPAYQKEAGGVDVPYLALLYLTGECNYGGRVTDDKDRRCLLSIINSLYHARSLEPDVKLSPSGLWRGPPADCNDYKGYMQFIDTLPSVPEPEVFGMHSNANISKDMKETTLLFISILSTQRGGGGAGTGKSRDDVISEVVNEVLHKLRKPFDLEAISGKYPVDWANSMNTVLLQELERFNRLLEVILDSMNNLAKAVKGLVLLSPTLEAVGDTLFYGRVPDMWLNASYPSLKPLAGYISDLVERLSFLQSWVDNNAPPVFWLSGFFFTQSFLTGALQNYARKYTLPIDTIDFDFEMLDGAVEDYPLPPEDGVYVYGLYIEGCKWNKATHVLDESDPKVLFTLSPVMWLKPCENDKLSDYPHYNCPVYKTSDRRGMLSTTGHSTNFVMFIRIPSDMPQDHWIQRGVACLTQLDD